MLEKQLEHKNQEYVH